MPMKLKFLEPAADPDNCFKQGHTYDFIDTAKARQFLDHGIAVPVEQQLEQPRPPAVTQSRRRKGKHEVDAIPTNA